MILYVRDLKVSIVYFVGNFQAGEPGAILKKFDSREHKSFIRLMKDILRSYVPEYRGDVSKNSESILYILTMMFQMKKQAQCIFQS